MLDWNEEASYHLMIDVLVNDGVVLAASDTVLGLFAQLSEKSKKKLDAIKKRNLKPYIILIKSTDLLNDFTDQYLDTSMLNIIDRYWPGPLTILFKAKSTLPEWMIGSQGTVAIRVPKHEGLQNLLQSVGTLFTTSANISDQPVPVQYADVNHDVLEQVGAVCCDMDTIYDGPASTIIDFSSGTIKIIRVGAVTIDSI